jgi:hypothetical protein
VLIEGLISSLIIGKLRGGKFKYLGQTNINKWWLFLLSFAIEFGTIFAVSAGISVADSLSMYLHILSYIILFIGILYNCEHKSMWLVFLGSFLNFIVIAINGGAMPVSMEGLQRAGLDDLIRMINTGGIATHQAITESTRLPFLADIFVLPKGYPFPKVLSIGDLLISVGIFAFVQKAMMLDRRLGKSNMIRFKYISKS